MSVQNKEIRINHAETHWNNYFNGEVARQRENLKMALIAALIITIIGVTAALVGLSTTSTSYLIDFKFDGTPIYQVISNAPFTCLPGLVGYISIPLLVFGISYYSKPSNRGADLTQEGPARGEMLRLFSQEGTLEMLKNYIDSGKLDFLVYQQQITIDEAKEMVGIAYDAKYVKGRDKETNARSTMGTTERCYGSALRRSTYLLRRDTE